MDGVVGRKLEIVYNPIYLNEVDAKDRVPSSLECRDTRHTEESKGFALHTQSGLVRHHL